MDREKIEQGFGTDFYKEVPVPVIARWRLYKSCAWRVFFTGKQEPISFIPGYCRCYKVRSPVAGSAGHEGWEVGFKQGCQVQVGVAPAGICGSCCAGGFWPFKGQVLAFQR